MPTKEEIKVIKFVTTISIWVLVLASLHKLPYLFSVWLALPSYLIMLWGCYGLLRIGYRIYNINDDEKEFVIFMDDVKKAKSYLKENGLIEK